MNYETISDPDHDRVIMRVQLPAPVITDEQVQRHLFAHLEAFNAWVQQQVSDGKAVIERNIETDGYRMRPLRPDDV